MGLLFADWQTEHPFGVEERGKGILVVGVPTSELASGVVWKGVAILQELSDFSTLCFIGLAPFSFGDRAAGIEVLVTNSGKFGAEFIDLAGKEVTLGLLNGDEGVRGD